MNERRRKTVRVMGFALIAVALCVIGYSAYDILSVSANTQSSLVEAEQLISDMNAYTGSPDVSQPPGVQTDGSFALTGSGQDGTIDPDQSADPNGDDALAPDTTSSTGGESPDSTAKTGKSSSGGSGGTASAKPKPTVLGILVFQSLGGRKVPVLEDVTDQNLARGAAHHPRTSPPGAVGNCVIFGHRDTVFRSFSRLKVGDTILLEVPGKTYTYAIQSTAVVDPSDPRIYQAYGQAAMTLVTCYPFNFVGSAPQRYIVVAVLQ